MSRRLGETYAPYCQDMVGDGKAKCLILFARWTHNRTDFPRQSTVLEQGEVFHDLLELLQAMRCYDNI